MPWSATAISATSLGARLRRSWSETGTRWSTADIAGLLKKTALVLTKRIGGTSGPIWGTAFLRAGGALNDIPEPTGEQVIAAMRASIEDWITAREHRPR